MPENLITEFRQLGSILVQLISQLESLGNLLILLVPVGLIGAWRWGIWAMRKVVGSWYEPQTPVDSDLTLTIVTPVYNEEPDLFRRALHSWASNTPDEIIAVIDYTDEACIREFNEFAKGYPHAKLIVTEKSGKRAALADGIVAATSDIVALVDSDTVWDDGVGTQVITPFTEPEVGGVATRQNVLTPKGLAQSLFDVYLDLRYLDEIRFLGAAGDALTCISGRTAVYRRSAVLPLVDELVNETFLGTPVISGDDKSLTHLLQKNGWKVRYQENARVYTPGKPKMRDFLKQRLRWSRNSWRADLRAIFSGWLWRRGALAFQLLDRLVQPITTLIAPTYFFLSLYYEQYFTSVILVIWWFLSRTVKIWGHLRRRRSSFIVLPAYIVFSYWFAIVRIYAFFTMNHQGWITRWDESRMKRVRPIRLLPGYVATAIMVFLVVSVINLLYNQQLLLASVVDPRVFDAEVELPNYNVTQLTPPDIAVEPPVTEVGAKDVAIGTTDYVLGEGDTPTSLARKYGVDPNAIFAPSGQWKIGEKVEIQLPFKDSIAYRRLLTQVSPRSDVSRASQTRIVYRSESNTIAVSGWSAIVDIPAIHAAVADNTLLEHEGNGNYLLKANLLIGRHAILLIDGPAVSWLKLKSDATGSVRIFGDSGNVLINNTMITSWDPLLNDYDRNSQDGRAHIRINNARMDMTNAEIAFLGQPLSRTSGGGVYGLAWRIENSSKFGVELTTGYIENTKIHHNYYGMYSYGATGMVLRNNEVYENERYGLDPHDDSNNFIVEHNYVHDNGDHGIIFSRRCFNNVIRWNRTVNNKLHGIMLDRESDFNSIYENTVLNNVDGIALWRSHNNAVYENELDGNKRGIRLNKRASDNVIYDNQIRNTEQYGVFLYQEARSNWIWRNQLEENGTGVYIRTISNYIRDNQIAGGKRGVSLNEEASGNEISRNQLAGNQTGIYLKTAPDDYIVDNIFQAGRRNWENIRVTNVWLGTE